MNVALCNDCLRGPLEIAGHENLVLAAEAGNRTAIYHCVACRSLWAREYRGEGRFGWTQVAAPEKAEAAR